MAVSFSFSSLQCKQQFPGNGVINTSAPGQFKLIRNGAENSMRVTYRRRNTILTGINWIGIQLKLRLNYTCYCNCGEARGFSHPLNCVSHMYRDVVGGSFHRSKWKTIYSPQLYVPRSLSLTLNIPYPEKFMALEIPDILRIPLVAFRRRSTPNLFGKSI